MEIPFGKIRRTMNRYKDLKITGSRTFETTEDFCAYLTADANKHLLEYPKGKMTAQLVKTNDSTSRKIAIFLYRISP